MTDFGLQDFLEHAPPPAAPRTGARRFWTMREEKILRESYPVGGLALCLEKLPGRSAKSIYQRAGDLGVRSPARRLPRQRWSTSEHMDAMIVRAYQRVPAKGDIKRLAATLGRPFHWVKSRALRLGCVVPRYKEPPWTEAEIDIVAAHAHRDPEVVRKHLKAKGFSRTATAIVLKVKRTGIDRTDPDHFTAHALAQAMGVDASTVTRWIEKLGLKASRRGTDRAASQGGDMWWIHRRDLRAFIIENVAAVDLRKVEKHWFVDLIAGGER